MPTINIANMNTIRANLQVLASFDGHPGLGGKGARKLQINAVTGVFGTKDGYFANIFQRGEEDSLLHRDTIATIKQMFENAINHMKTYTGADKQREVTRKLLFDGLRGLVYLAHHGYRSRTNYGLLQAMITSIKDGLEDPLKIILRNGLTDQLWFETGVQVTKRATFSQSDFLEDPMGGICHGICMDWCRRVLLKNKYSFETSSKQNEWDQIMREIVTFQNTRRDDTVSEIRNNIIQDPALTTEAMRREEFIRQATPVFRTTAENIIANKQTIQNMRYRKKSTYQALAQHTQREITNTSFVVGEEPQNSMETAMVAEKIGLLQLHKLECESKLNGTFKTTIQYGNLIFEDTPQFTEKQKDSFRKTITQIDNAVGAIGTSFPIAKAAAKFSRMEYHDTDRLNIPEATVLCMSDPSDFQNHINPLINRCLNSMIGMTPKAFYLSFKFGGNYAGIDKSGGHAMAFSKDPVTNTYYAIDPNYGEFSSQTVDGLVFIFCVLLSRYSLTRNINVIETATVSLSDIP